MACSWDINYGDPNPETEQVLCRCPECGKYVDLDCDRGFCFRRPDRAGHDLYRQGWLPGCEGYPRT